MLLQCLSNTLMLHFTNISSRHVKIESRKFKFWRDFLLKIMRHRDQGIVFLTDENVNRDLQLKINVFDYFGDNLHVSTNKRNVSKRHNI